MEAIPKPVNIDNIQRTRKIIMKNLSKITLVSSLAIMGVGCGGLEDDSVLANSASAVTPAECDSKYDMDIDQCQRDARYAPTWMDQFNVCLLNTCGTLSATHQCVQAWLTQVDCSNAAAEHVEEVAMAQAECEEEAAVAWGECSVAIEALTEEEELNENIDDLLDDGLSDIDENGDVWGD
jgi:hypothetical protein